MFIKDRISGIVTSFDREALVCDAPSRPDAVGQVCAQVREFIQKRGLAMLEFSTELVLRECLTNAIVHGNHCNASKRLKLRVEVKNDIVRLCVSDEGEGFDWRDSKKGRLPEATATAGRGLAIIGLYGRRVTFNRAGNRITVEIGKQDQRRTK